MQPPFFNQAASWVCQQQTLTMQPPVPEGEVAEALSALHGLATQCRAAIMVPDLFPGSRLETIVIPAPAASGSHTASQTGSAKLLNSAAGARITVPALSAIGSALMAEMERTGQDMARCELDGGSEAIAYLPDVRGAVLRATGLVLLNG